jgi:hypothetical protein
MKHDAQFHVEVQDVAAGLWIWRLEHPHWKQGQGWEPLVTSTCVESGGETLVLDPLAIFPLEIGSHFGYYIRGRYIERGWITW